MKQMMLVALVAIMFTTLVSTAFAQGTLTGAPTCANSSIPAIDGTAVVSSDTNGETTYVIAGANGRDGQDGQNGYNGRDGQNGANGYNGQDGRTGTTGRTGHRGGRGPRGYTGQQGIQGVPGRDGRDGYNIMTVPASTTTSGDAGEGGNSMVGLWVVLGILAAGGLGWAITATIMASDSKVRLADAAIAQGQIGIGHQVVANQGQYIPDPNAVVETFAAVLPHGGVITRSKHTPVAALPNNNQQVLIQHQQLPAPQQQALPAPQNPVANVMMTDASFAALMGAAVAHDTVINVGQPGQA
jgi:hypothetical protein